MNDDNNKRYCGRFNMSAREFQNYKEWKKIRVILYIVAMIGSSIFIDRISLWFILTIYLMFKIGHEHKCEEQWIKDGSITKEDLK
ncbi:hypothetical protein [Clostridium sp. Marseille-P299]|uniref:hypothetical protein n=1 Tax=Clostridium sp. Marseille-P299 TaxID=1805477 RepID=UPI00082B17AD|nr:hypothetical protein [Clostridium sp. Marseille-P299]